MLETLKNLIKPTEEMTHADAMLKIARDGGFNLGCHYGNTLPNDNLMIYSRPFHAFRRDVEELCRANNYKRIANKDAWECPITGDTYRFINITSERDIDKLRGAIYRTIVRVDIVRWKEINYYIDALVARGVTK